MPPHRGRNKWETQVLLFSPECGLAVCTADRGLQPEVWLSQGGRGMGSPAGHSGTPDGKKEGLLGLDLFQENYL